MTTTPASPVVVLDATDAVELGEALQLLVDWLSAEGPGLAALDEHLGVPGAAHDVVVDLARLARLLPGTDPLAARP